MINERVSMSKEQKFGKALVLRMVTYALHKFPKRQDGGVTGHEFGYRVLRELSQVAAFSVTILLHLSNLFVIYRETKHMFAKQFA